MNLEKELRNGVDFDFDNENWCEENQQDDVIEGWVSFNQRVGKFTIHLNGSLIHSVKTFKAFEKKLNGLMEIWNCEFL